MSTTLIVALIFFALGYAIAWATWSESMAERWGERGDYALKGGALLGVISLVVAAVM